MLFSLVFIYVGLMLAHSEILFPVIISSVGQLLLVIVGCDYLDVFLGWGLE